MKALLILLLCAAPVAGAEPVRPKAQPLAIEIEGNDTVEQANPIGRNKTLTAQLSDLEDQDWFVYTVRPHTPRRIKAQLSCKQAQLALPPNEQGRVHTLYVLSFYNPSMALQSRYAINDRQCERKGLRFALNVPVPGDYYLSVSGGDWPVTTDYKLRLGAPIPVSSVPPCADRGGLVKWPLQVSITPENRNFYCGREPVIAFCHPYVWGCLFDGPPPEGYTGPPSGH